MMTTTERKLKVNSENILPIIKKWLYSDKDIFVRELVSNAMDAIQKVKMLRDRGELDIADDAFRIDIKVDPEAKTLTFSDTGIGMTADEVEKYIAQVAFSGAEEFMEKYKSDEEKDQIIGHFGLGFYSAYMIAGTVDIQTRSYRENAEPALWSCDGGTDYSLEAGSRETRGTDITLHVTEEEKEFLDATRVREILTRYCSFLPCPLYLNGEQVNTQEPLWIKAPSECTEKEYLDFFHHLYPTEPDPLFWIHLNVDYPFNLKGILYFPKQRNQPQADKGNIQLYCNRVFVSDECKDLIPDFLLGLRGVIDSPDIPLNVSRSYLQMDRTVRQVSSHVSKKVADKLSTLYKSDKEQYISVWPDIHGIVKLGALQDDKFYDRTKQILIWKNTKNEWTTAEEYLERQNGKTNDKIFYTTDAQTESRFLKLYQDKNIEVLHADNYIDSYVISFMENKLEKGSFQRIDGAIDDAILDPSREQTLLDEEGRSQASRTADFIRRLLDRSNVEVEAKSLASDELPGFVMLDEQQRRMRDYMVSMDPNKGSAEMEMFGKRTFVVNTNHKLVHSVQNLEGKNPDLAKALVQHMYDLALLSQREMNPDQLNAFVNRSSEVLEQLTDVAAK